MAPGCSPKAALTCHGRPRVSCIDGPADARDFSSTLVTGRVRSCIRPVSATDAMVAGPDGDRGSRPHQRVALVALKTLRAFSIPSSAGFHHAVICPHTLGWPKKRGSSGRELRPIELTGRHHCPDDPSQLVGDSDGNNHGPTPFKKGFDPASSDPGPGLWIPNDGCVPR